MIGWYTLVVGYFLFKAKIISKLAILTFVPAFFLNLPRMYRVGRHMFSTFSALSIHDGKTGKHNKLRNPRIRYMSVDHSNRVTVKDSWHNNKGLFKKLSFRLLSKYNQLKIMNVTFFFKNPLVITH